MCLLTSLEHLLLLCLIVVDGGSPINYLLILLLILLLEVVVLAAAGFDKLLQVVDHLAVVFFLLLVGLLWYHRTLEHCSIMDFDFLQRRCKLMIVVQTGYSSLMVCLLPLR